MPTTAIRALLAPLPLLLLACDVTPTCEQGEPLSADEVPCLCRNVAIERVPSDDTVCSCGPGGFTCDGPPSELFWY